MLSPLLLSTRLLAETEQTQKDPPLAKNHLLYLMRSNKVAASIDLYKEYKKTLKGKHDSELLEQMALILLEQGMASHDEEKEAISLYGASLAGVNSLLDLCEIGMKSKHPMTQLISIQLAGQIQDDRVNDLLCKAFSSDFLGIRMEAASYLARRKHLHAVGYIESLMNKLPPPFRCFFAEMYAQIGTSEATIILKKMIHDTELYTRVAATLAAANYGRDDLLRDIRNAATHLNPAEQEACALALGMLADSHSIELLQKMTASTEDQVKLAAYRALFSLGKRNYLEDIKTLAKNKDLFAIYTLGFIEGGEDLLYELLQDKDKQIRFNAALALLQRRDNRCLPTISELLLSKKHDLGFLPHHSQGKSMMHWKVIPSASGYVTKEDNGILAISLALREQALIQCMELSEQAFFTIAQDLFRYQQKDLIPLLMNLLCNLNQEQTIAFLKEKAEDMTSPFIRYYASLTLTKLKVEGPYKERLESWISKQQDTEMIRFRPMTTKSSSETSFNYQLTPQENSALLIEALMFIANSHEEKGIDILLDVLRNGHPKNHPVLAGLLIKALE
jgi:HEAT repeat protein